jgi:hypothetical protein
MKRIECAKCGLFLAGTIDDCCLIAGNCVFFDRVRFACRCGSSFSFVPRIPLDSLTDEQKAIRLEILNGLAKNG